MYWNFSLSLSHSGVFRCVSHSWDFTAHIHISLMLIWIKSDSEVMWIYEHFIFKTLLFDWLSCERHPGPVKTDGAPFWSPNWRHTVELSQQLQRSTASLDNLCKLHSWSYTFIDKTKYRTIRNVLFPPCLDHLLSFYWSVIVNKDVRNKTAADYLYVTDIYPTASGTSVWALTGPPPPAWTWTSPPQGGLLIWCQATSAGSVPHEGAAAVLLVPGEGTDSQVHIGCTGAPSSRPACVRPEQAQTEEPTWNQGSKYHRGLEGGSKEEAYIHSSIFSILDTKYFYFTTSQREIWYFLHYIYLTATLQTFIQKHMKKGAQ